MQDQGKCHFGSGFRRCWLPLAPSRFLLRRGSTGSPRRPGGLLGQPGRRCPRSGCSRLHRAEAIIGLLPPAPLRDVREVLSAGGQFFRRFVPLGRLLQPFHPAGGTPSFQSSDLRRMWQKRNGSGGSVSGSTYPFSYSCSHRPVGGWFQGNTGLRLTGSLSTCSSTCTPRCCNGIRTRLEALARPRDRLQNQSA